MAFPEEFIKRIEHQQNIDAESLLRGLSEPSPISIRLNTLKWSKIPSDSEPVPWCRNGYYLESRPSFTLDPLFHSGCYYPQEASSMFLEQALYQAAGSLKNIRVLDLCGAPGGKSTHISEIIGRDNLLVSNEVIRSRASVLAETITKWGHGNTIITQNDPAAFGRLKGFFDIIIVDAPCSGEGMFRNPTAVNEWTESNALLCSERQKRILMDIWPSLKQDGIIIYSTCTFNPGENEENIKWLIEKTEAECVGLDISSFTGVEEIQTGGVLGYGFYPGKVRGEGFFISVIRKSSDQEIIKLKSQKSQLKPEKRDIQTAEIWARFPRERLIRWGDEIIGIPCSEEEYLNLFQNLRIVKSGTKLFSVKKDDYLPSHELALSVQINNEAFQRTGLTWHQAVAYLRRDVFSVDGMPEGWNIVSYNGINLGFVKNLGKRFNNYFPVDWRIRMSATGKEKITEWGI